MNKVLHTFFPPPPEPPENKENFKTLKKNLPCFGACSGQDCKCRICPLGLGLPLDHNSGEINLRLLRQIAEKTSSCFHYKNELVKTKEDRHELVKLLEIRKKISLQDFKVMLERTNQN